jgi:beta-lactamase regulating signal transducer with metallopeptidase domain
MIAFISFPILAALAVWWAGRKDAARDPRLTALALGLLVLLPMLLLLPKVEILPAVEATASVTESAIPSWLLPSIWAVGFILALGRLLLSAIGLSRWHKQSHSLGYAAGGVELRQLPYLRSPVAAGVFRKAIFVPKEWSSFDEETKRTVLLHELAHHRRRDPLVRWLAAFATAIHWFNPLVHWMNRRLAAQCEHACDDHVVANGVSSGFYADMLCRFASRRPAVAGLAMADRSTLELRVRHLMSPKRSRGFFTLAALAGIVMWSGILLPLLGRKAAAGPVPDHTEIELRLSANPFPADAP